MTQVTLTGTSKTDINWNYTNNSFETSTPKDSGQMKVELDFSDGDGIDQAQIIFHDQRFVSSASPNDDLDLVGILLDVFGNTLSFVTITQIYIRNLGVKSGSTFLRTSGHFLLVGNGGANSFNDVWNGVDASAHKIGPGGRFFIDNPVDGWTVASGTADILRIAHGGGASPIHYEIVIWGRET